MCLVHGGQAMVSTERMNLLRAMQLGDKAGSLNPCSLENLLTAFGLFWGHTWRCAGVTPDSVVELLLMGLRGPTQVNRLQSKCPARYAITLALLPLLGADSGTFPSQEPSRRSASPLPSLRPPQKKGEKHNTRARGGSLTLSLVPSPRFSGGRQFPPVASTLQPPTPTSPP